ncbi:hypothetical protein NL483_28395, partial [Klebsiella pneumoniae]|nr:hypothetical protein [Klebsiella pneumoniae]
GVPKNTPFRSLRAYELFRKWIADFASNGPSDQEADTGDTEANQPTGMAPPELVEQRIEALLQALLSHMKLVVITLGEGDDAQ